MSVAKIILEQLGGNKFAIMTGAKNFVDLGNGVQMNIGSGAKNKANKMVVTLNEFDTYDVKFFSIRGVNITDKGEFSGVYADGLARLFTAETGFYTSL